MRAAAALYRLRAPIFYGAAAILLVNVIVLQFPLAEGVRQAWATVVIAAVFALFCSVALSYLVPKWAPVAPPAPVMTVNSPVHGRWLGMNSPATQTPSHGTRAYGQEYAIDLVHEPAGVARPAFGGSAMRGSEEYPAFGQPVLAMLDGTVVRASGWQRDHRARSSTLGLLYLAAEGMIRQLAGPGCVVGNHVTIRGDDGVFAAVGHLRRGSLAVAVGDRVTAGSPIGECGNSGNSSEPHVHAQLMDRASLWTAQGLPMAFAGITLDDDPTPVDGLPANEQHMIATPAERC